MAEQELVFDNAVEGLFTHALRGRVTPALKARLREVGVDLDRPLRPAYERAQWCRVLAITVQEAFPGMAREEALRVLGRLLTQGYDETLLGRSIIAVARAIGPRGMLDRLSRSLRSSNTYVSATVTHQGPGESEVRCSGLDSAHLMAGILDAGMDFAGARDFQVELLAAEGHEASYRVTWREG